MVHKQIWLTMLGWNQESPNLLNLNGAWNWSFPFQFCILSLSKVKDRWKILSFSVERSSSSTFYHSHDSHEQFLDLHRNCFLQSCSPSFTILNFIDLQRLYFQEGLKFPRGRKHSVFLISWALVIDTGSLTQWGGSWPAPWRVLVSILLPSNQWN